MFKTIAEKVGPNLTIKNWQKTVNKFGKIDLRARQVRVALQGQVRRRRQLPARGLRLEPRARPATGRR